MDSLCKDGFCPFHFDLFANATWSNSENCTYQNIGRGPSLRLAAFAREQNPRSQVPTWEVSNSGYVSGEKFSLSRPRQALNELKLSMHLWTQPKCRLLRASLKNYWTTSSTIYTTRDTTSRTVASYLNHGSPALESTSLPLSAFTTKGTSNHGKTCFLILPSLLPIIPKLWSSGAPSLSQLEMWKRVAGFRPFLALCA